MNGDLGLLVAIHLAATATMVGLIWFVQVVHYPLFTAVGRDAFAAYERAHQQRTSALVLPLMGTETLATVALAVLAADPTTRLLAYSGAGLLVVIHASTFGLQMPRHRRLARGFDPEVARSLVRTNWIRTAGWTARGMVAVGLVAAT